MILELIVIFAALVLLAIIMLLKLERGIRKQNNKLLKNLDSDLIKDITDE